jgi:hypothetical protein
MASLRLREIDELWKLERQVVNLIYLIDNFHNRDNRLVLEGYLLIHKRECPIGELCPCQLIDFTVES